MTPRVKSALLLVATLLIGGVLGALLNARMAEQRMERIAFLRSQRGFVRGIEQAIEFRDEAQQEAVRRILDGSAERIREHMLESRAEVQAILESTRVELGTVLSDEQMEALDEQMQLRRPSPWRERRGPPLGRPPRHPRE